MRGTGRLGQIYGSLGVGESSDLNVDSLSFGASNRDLLNVKEALSIMEEANLG